MTTSPPVTVVSVGTDALRVEVSTHGAALRTVETPDRWGRAGSVHLHLPTPTDDLDPHRNPYLGATVGRVANRVAGASARLEGHALHLIANDGAHQLHGGPLGFSRRSWTLAEATESDRGGQIVLALRSPDGDQGYPGTLDARVTYEVDGPTLRITHEARTDRTTFVNLVNHAYWNLDPLGDEAPGATDTAEHLLSVAADAYVPVDPERIPLTGLASVEGTPFDLRRPSPVGEVVRATGGLDHSFAVADQEGTLRPVAWLHSPRSGRCLEVRTDQVGVQVYDGAGLGPPFVAHGGICLEAQRHPDTPNRPALGSAVLRPGEIDRRLTGVGRLSRANRSRSPQAGEPESSAAGQADRIEARTSSA